MPNRQRAILILVSLSLLAVASFGLALMVGSYQVAPAEVFAALLGQEGGAGDIVLQLRLPRALAGFACGGLLALAGALMQVLLRNPLADPYVLGISGGAGVGAMFAILIGLPTLASTAWPLRARWAPCFWSSGWPMAMAAGHRPACC
jgi:iron complex transport system permease protein